MKIGPWTIDCIDGDVDRDRSVEAYIGSSEGHIGRLTVYFSDSFGSSQPTETCQYIPQSLIIARKPLETFKQELLEYVHREITRIGNDESSLFALFHLDWERTSTIGDPFFALLRSAIGPWELEFDMTKVPISVPCGYSCCSQIVNGIRICIPILEIDQLMSWIDDGNIVWGSNQLIDFGNRREALSFSEKLAHRLSRPSLKSTEMMARKLIRIECRESTAGGGK